MTFRRVLRRRIRPRAWFWHVPCLLLAALILNACGSGWKGPRVPVEAIPTGHTDIVTVEHLPVYPHWTFKHAAFIGSPPAAVGRLLAVADHKGRVKFLDPNTGKPKAEIKGKGAIRLTPVWDSHRMFILTTHSSRHLQAFSLDGGKRIWFRKFSLPPESPIEVGEELWLPVRDTLYRLEPATGEIKGAVARGGDAWLTPVPAPNGMAVIGRQGHMRFFDSEGTEIWSYDVAAPCEYGPVIAADHMWLATAEGSVLCLSTSGQPAWDRRLDSTALFQGVHANGRLVIAARSGRLWSLDPAGGEVLWERALSAPLAGSPVVQKYWLAAATLDGTLWLLDPDSGETRDSLVFESILSQPPTWAFGRLFVVDSDRKLYAFGASP